MQQIRGKFSTLFVSIYSNWNISWVLSFLREKWDPLPHTEQSSDGSWKVNNDFILSDPSSFTRNILWKKRPFIKEVYWSFCIVFWVVFLRRDRLQELAQKRCKLHFTLLPRSVDPCNLPVPMVKEALQKRTLDCKVLVHSSIDFWYGLEKIILPPHLEFSIWSINN